MNGLYVLLLCMAAAVVVMSHYKKPDLPAEGEFFLVSQFLRVMYAVSACYCRRICQWMCSAS